MQKGVIEAPDGLEIEKVKLDTVANVLYVIFKNSNQFGMLSYEPKRMLRSLMEHGLAVSNVISLTDEPVSDIHIKQHTIIVEHDKSSSPIQYSLFENASAAKGGPAGGGSSTSSDSASSGSAKSSSSWSFSSLQYLLVPGIVTLVVLYQLCLKESPKPRRQDPG